MTLTYVKCLPTPIEELNAIGETPFSMFLHDYSKIFHAASSCTVNHLLSAKKFNKSACNTYLQQKYGINKRHAHGIIASVKGRVSSVVECRKEHLKVLKRKLTSAKKWLKSANIKLASCQKFYARSNWKNYNSSSLFPLSCNLRHRSTNYQHLKFQVHHKKRRIYSLTQQIEHLKLKPVRIKVAAWDVFVVGSKDETHGNQICQWDGEWLKFRVPYCLEAKYGKNIVTKIGNFNRNINRIPEQPLSEAARRKTTGGFASRARTWHFYLKDGAWKVALQYLQSEISLVVDGMFGSRSLSTVQSAVKRFLESYPIGDRAIRLEQIIRESEPLLPLNTSDPYFYNDTGKSLNIIGFKDTDKPEIAQFKNILFKDLGVADSDLKPIQAEDEIILVREYAAFPLRLIQSLPQMRAHYQRQKTHGKGFLHNDYRTQFIDIIPPDAGEINNLQDIFYPSLAFELLPFNKNTQEYELSYHDSFRDEYTVASLGYVWDEALEKLASLEDMTEALDAKLKEAIADLTHQPQKWNSYYLPKLRQFVTTVDSLPENDPNYLYKEIVVGTRGGINQRQQDGIVNRFWKKMQDVVRVEMEKQEQQKLAAPIEHLLTEGDSIDNKQSNEIVGEIEFVSNPLQDDDSIIDPELADSDPDSEIIQKLERLRKLRQKGMLSEENFKVKEKELLDKFF